VHLVGFIIRIYHDARSPERQKQMSLSHDCSKNIAEVKVNGRDLHYMVWCGIQV